jgi:hypothetical protein
MKDRRPRIRYSTLSSGRLWSARRTKILNIKIPSHGVRPAELFVLPERSTGRYPPARIAIWSGSFPAGSVGSASPVAQASYPGSRSGGSGRSGVGHRRQVAREAVFSEVP